MNELGIQRELVKAAIAEGGFAFKSASTHMLGVVDLWVQLQRLPGMYIEVKFARKFVGKPPYATLELTPHQARFIRRNQRAGGYAGWVMVVATTRGAYSLRPGWGAEEDEETQQLFLDGLHWTYKGVGGKWPIREVVERILSLKPLWHRGVADTAPSRTTPT